MASTPSLTPQAKERHLAQMLDFIERAIPEADLTSILLFRQMRKADQLLMHAAKRKLEAAGLSWPQLMLLMLLQGNETYGARSGLQPSELSELMGTPRNQVSLMIETLEGEGLISRELHGTDRRSFIIRLTLRGRKILKSRLGTQCRQIARCFAAFSAKERATLLEFLTRLTQSLAEIPDRDDG
jgi:MarR family transcriptional regulator, negative regulator of the multidrug operon emrRAB